MKKFLKTGLVAALIFTALGVYANDDDFALKVKGEKEKFIRFSAGKVEDVDLSLVSADDEVLYRERIHTSVNNQKLYDLSALPNGEYVLNVETESKLVKYNVVIENGEAIVSEPKISNMFKPVCIKKDNVVTLSLNNQDKSPIEVKVYNEYNEEVYGEKFKNKALLTKQFNISKTDSKSLTFVVEFKDERFTKTFETN